MPSFFMPVGKPNGSSFFGFYCDFASIFAVEQAEGTEHSRCFAQWHEQIRKANSGIESTSHI